MVLANKKRCEWGTACDPFIKLSIDGRPMWQSESQTNDELYEVGFTYLSPKISKNASIKMELLDADYDNNPELVLRAEGNVDSFVRNGYYEEIVAGIRVGSGFRTRKTSNFIDTVSFWQDEYNYTTATGKRLSKSG